MNKVFHSFAFLIALSVVLCSSCKIENIEYRRFENFALSGISASPNINLDMVYYNPNKVGCKLCINGCYIISGTDTLANVLAGATNIRLKPMSEFKVPLSSTINAPALISISSASLFNGKDIPININGSFTVKKFIFSRKFPFTVKEKINRKQILKF